MTCYSIQPRGLIFVKGCLSFARNMRKNIDKSISKNLNSKYSRKLLDHAKKSSTDALKTAAKKLLIKLRKVHHRKVQTVESEKENAGIDREIPEERYIYLQKKDRKLLMI